MTFNKQDLTLINRLVILRMYGPLEPWLEKTWRPGEVELAK